MKILNQKLLAILNNLELIANSKTKEGFRALVEEVKTIENYKNPIAFAFSRDDEVEVLENNKYIKKVAQCNMANINYKKDGGESIGAAAIMHLALVASGCKVHNGSSESVYDINAEVVDNALSLFEAYIQEAMDDKDDHLNIQMLLDLETIFKKPAKYIPLDYNPIGNDSNNCGTTRDNYRIVFLFEDAEPKSVQTVFLKLYAISTKKAALREPNLGGAFGILTNVSWVDVDGTRIPVSLDYLRENERMLKLQGIYPVIAYTDKFPTLQQHVILANNTRILDEKKVRFGAQLAAGTTVMPGASYINFNAGTLGPVMVEGRISSSAIVGAGSDVGGGASILGVLSGTDGNPISIGENTLLGANSVTGIPLGNSCIVDAGVAILEGTKVTLSKKEVIKLNEANPEANIKAGIIKAGKLQGLNGIHFRQLSAPSKEFYEILNAIKDIIKAKEESPELENDEKKLNILIDRIQELVQAGSVVAIRSKREVKLNSELH